MGLILFILWAAVALAVVFAGLTYVIFWYEVLNLGPRAFDPQAHGGARRLVLSGLFWSVASLLVATVTYVFGWMRGLSQPDPYCKKGKLPVLFVHGIYHNPSAWIFARWWLGQRGYENLHSFGYPSFKTDFATIADRLSLRLHEVSQENHGSKVILVGHSLGGLLIQAVLGDPRNAALAAAVVTLGTPFRGSKLAVLAIGRLGRSLTLGGPVASGLPAFPDPDVIPWLALATPIDNMVLPPEALVPASPGPDFHQTAPVCHVGLLYHKPTTMAVADFLDRAAPLPGGAA